MEIIKQFDTVILKDGRTAAVTEVYGDQEVFDIDTGSSPEDWDWDSVERDEIVKVLRNK